MTMNDHEAITPGNSYEARNEWAPTVPSVPAEAQPLILYDLAAIVVVVHQQRITLTRQGTVTKRCASLLRPLLHGSPWNDERREDAYVNMLCEAAKQLHLIYSSFSYDDDEDKPYYCPAIESGLGTWSQINVHEQARQFLAWWRGSSQWHDVWSPAFRQWDSRDWNPLAATYPGAGIPFPLCLIRSGREGRMYCARHACRKVRAPNVSLPGCGNPGTVARESCTRAFFLRRFQSWESSLPTNMQGI